MTNLHAHALQQKTYSLLIIGNSMHKFLSTCTYLVILRHFAVLLSGLEEVHTNKPHINTARSALRSFDEFFIEIAFPPL